MILHKKRTGIYRFICYTNLRGIFDEKRLDRVFGAGLFCGDTPFYAFGYEIKDFFLIRKKTGRRYGAIATSYKFINKKEPAFTGSYVTQICEHILMRCAVNSIFDCAGVLICTPSNQIIEVCKQVAK